MWKYAYQVPENKKIRVIVHTDCKNEADDQFALAHHLMTPKFMIKAIIAGHFWGLPGILMGNITSLFLIIVIWKPYFLYSQGFKIPVLHYWMGYIKHLLIILLPGIVCYHLYPSNDFTPESSFTHWILYGMILISTYGILTCSLLYLFTPGIRAFAHRILKRHH